MSDLYKFIDTDYTYTKPETLSEKTKNYSPIDTATSCCRRI